MDAQTLYQDGVSAIRDHGDLERGQALLAQSLRHNPQNDMAWLWLTRTVPDPRRQLEYVDRALRINPANPHAQKLKAQLDARLYPQTQAQIPPIQPLPTQEPAAEARSVIAPIAPLVDSAQPPALAPSHAAAPQAESDSPHLPAIIAKTVEVPVSKVEKEHIVQLMQRAEEFVAAGNIEAAIEQWVDVLAIRVDYEEALAKASGHLWRMHYQEDARELIGRAVLAGTRIPTIYMTAIDMAERHGDFAEAEALREHIASLPDADEQLLVTVVDYYSKRVQLEQAMQFIKRALKTNPDRQKLLMRMGDILEELHRSQEAMTYYDRAVRLGTRTREGKEADKRLSRAVPVITDRERGSVFLALRETAGFVIFLFVMAWQDASLNLLDMGLRRWVGVLLGFVGGYLLVTATSSPQQDPVASWLGGVVPDQAWKDRQGEHLSKPGQAKQHPTELPILGVDARSIFGFVGMVVLALAVWLVFYRSIGIVIDYPPPYLPW